MNVKNAKNAGHENDANHTPFQHAGSFALVSSSLLLAGPDLGPTRSLRRGNPGAPFRRYRPLPCARSGRTNRSTLNSSGTGLGAADLGPARSLRRGNPGATFRRDRPLPPLRCGSTARSTPGSCGTAGAGRTATNASPGQLRQQARGSISNFFQLLGDGSALTKPAFGFRPGSA
jgi:hypothetical protein